MPNYGDNTEQTIDSCNNVGGHENNYAEGKKASHKCYILCDFIHMPFNLSEKANSKDG